MLARNIGRSITRNMAYGCLKKNELCGNLSELPKLVSSSSIRFKHNLPTDSKHSSNAYLVHSKNSDQDTPCIDEMVSSIYELVANCKPEGYTEEEKQTKKLAPRTLSHSYRKFVIPLSTDAQKQKEYLSAMGNVRIGKILEDLDHMAVHVAYVHNSDEGHLQGKMTLPRTIVTASVHRIDFHKEDINKARDIIIDGQVTYAGSSSMQISIRLFQNDDNNNLVLLLKANFIMVSRDPLDSKKKIRVHGLVAKTPDEAEVMNMTKEQIKMMGDAGSRQPRNDELRLIHDVYNELIMRNPGSDIPMLDKSEMWLHKTRVSLTEICFPEYQNMYGKIFGGFLMRKALELASTNAKLYCKGRVALRSMDRIEFTRPVEIGHVLHLESHITYTEDRFVQVRVAASISDQNKLPELARLNCATLGQEARIQTNEFNFTMESVENLNILKVLPKHYIHAGTYIEGRRLLKNTLKRIVN